MKNCNKKVQVICPSCNKERTTRSDVVAKAEKLGIMLCCKSCRSKARFINNPHPTKGTGIKNNPELKRTSDSFFKAKQRCKMGEKHNRAYAGVEFKFVSLQQLIEEIGTRPEGYSLDRINGAGHYEPGNVRWATRQQQSENRFPRNFWESHKRENGKIIEIEGVKHCVPMEPCEKVKREIERRRLKGIQPRQDYLSQQKEKSSKNANKARKMRDDGATQVSIAKSLGITQQRVSALLRVCKNQNNPTKETELFQK